MPRKSILIVDDEANQRLVMLEALRSINQHCQITTFGNAKDALVYAVQVKPDIVITDYNMPSMNGIDLITQLRDSKIDAAIILMTAHSSAELYEAAHKLRIAYYLTKPTSINVLRRTVQLLLESPTLTTQLLANTQPPPQLGSTTTVQPR
jgi:DNA-binding NtrC family response regulator